MAFVLKENFKKWFCRKSFSVWVIYGVLFQESVDIVVKRNSVCGRSVIREYVAVNLLIFATFEKQHNTRKYIGLNTIVFPDDEGVTFMKISLAVVVYLGDNTKINNRENK